MSFVSQLQRVFDRSSAEESHAGECHYPGLRYSGQADDD